MPRRATVIVVGIAERPTAFAALDAAAGLARDLADELHVVHAIDLGDYPVDPDIDDWEKRADAKQATVRARAAAALYDYRSIGWTYHARRGAPEHVLLAVAHSVGARMIVIGSHPHSFLGYHYGGSVSRALLRQHEYPILLVSEHGQA
ncbi:universal stress protein [Nocardia brasiliensis]|uniref:universal stress protein n=1 Tax=Nocardia brasiliensis TaxID=37326 RepID=UPI0024541C12|nr:universal stress protein [Nocardia brasiliensis]